MCPGCWTDSRSSHQWSVGRVSQELLVKDDALFVSEKVEETELD